MIITAWAVVGVSFCADFRWRSPFRNRDIHYRCRHVQRCSGYWSLGVDAAAVESVFGLNFLGLLLVCSVLLLAEHLDDGKC